MAEEDETRDEAVKVPVSAGPCSLLAWPLGNLTSLITGKDGRPVFRWFFFCQKFLLSASLFRGSKSPSKHPVQV